MTWLSPPPTFSTEGGVLELRTAPRTDFWQGTHYGFRRDDGHFLNRSVKGDFRIEAAFRLAPKARFDQAGLMVRVDASNWTKTSIEFEPSGPSHLGAVVTHLGWSDWSMAPVDVVPKLLRLSIERQSLDLLVRGALDDAPLRLLRVARLALGHAPERVQVGPYACSPDGEGFVAVVESFDLDERASGEGTE